MLAHNPKVVSSNLAPATLKKVRSLDTSPFCVSAMACARAQGNEGHVMGGVQLGTVLGYRRRDEG